MTHLEEQQEETKEIEQHAATPEIKQEARTLENKIDRIESKEEFEKRLDREPVKRTTIESGQVRTTYASRGLQVQKDRNRGFFERLAERREHGQITKEQEQEAELNRLRTQVKESESPRYRTAKEEKKYLKERLKKARSKPRKVRSRKPLKAGGRGSPLPDVRTGELPKKRRKGKKRTYSKRRKAALRKEIMKIQDKDKRQKLLAALNKL